MVWLIHYSTNISWYTRNTNFVTYLFIKYAWGFHGGSVVKNLPAMQEMQETHSRSLGQEYPLEKGMATHSSTVVWRIPWTEEPGRLQSIESQRVGHDWSNLASTYKILFTFKARKVNAAWNLKVRKTPLKFFTFLYFKIIEIKFHKIENLF